MSDRKTDATNSTDKPTPTRSGSSRRDFLRKGAATVAGTSLAAAIAPRTYAVGDDTIRIGLIGTGGRGSGAVQQAMSTSGPVKFVAAADAFKDRLDFSLRNIGRNKTIAPNIDIPEDSKYTGPLGWQKIMERDDINLVILTTPPGLRPMMFEAAVKAGKHVFMEKPVGTDAPGIRRLLAANEIAKQKNLKVGVGLQRHHQKNYVDNVKRLKDGAIGKFVNFRVYWNGGGVWTRPRASLANILGRNPTEMEYQARNWYYFNWLCGDHICEQHIHNLDIANWCMGTHPVKAQGQGGREVRTSNENGHIFDHHMVEYTYADGTKMLSQCRHIRGCWNQVSEFVEGTKGTSRISNSVELYDGTKLENTKGGKNPYQQEHDDLFEAIRKDKPFNEAEYGAHSTFTSILGRMATYSGKEVHWDEALQWGKKLVPETDGLGFDKTPPIVPNDDGSYPVAVPGKYDPLIDKKDRKNLRSTATGYEKV